MQFLYTSTQNRLLAVVNLFHATNGLHPLDASTNEFYWSSHLAGGPRRSYFGGDRRGGRDLPVRYEPRSGDWITPRFSTDALASKHLVSGPAFHSLYEKHHTELSDVHTRDGSHAAQTAWYSILCLREPLVTWPSPPPLDNGDVIVDAATTSKHAVVRMSQREEKRRARRRDWNRERLDKRARERITPTTTAEEVPYTTGLSCSKSSLLQTFDNDEDLSSDVSRIQEYSSVCASTTFQGPYDLEENTDDPLFEHPPPSKRRRIVSLPTPEDNNTTSRCTGAKQSLLSTQSILAISDDDTIDQWTSLSPSLEPFVSPLDSGNDKDWLSVDT